MAANSPFFNNNNNKGTQQRFNPASAFKPVRPHHAVIKLTTYPPPDNVDKAPTMPSDTTKRKLKAFQFIEGAPEGIPTLADQDKENKAPGPKLKPYVIITGVPVEQDVSRSNDDTSSKNNDVPSTPVNQVRLPLTHLLANMGPKILQPTLSPHLAGVGWDLKKDTPPPGKDTPGKTPRRSKKRARSSSPPGSTEALHQKYKTPKQDPAAEVWSRFRGDAKLNDSAMRASQDGIEALILNSSPRSSETAGSVGGLRRYNSCGYQFPISRKKRKTMNPGGSVGNIVEEEEEEDDDEQEPEVEAKPVPRISKIGQLLKAADRLKAQQEHESLTAEAGPCKSSPPPPADERQEEIVDDGQSPLRNRGTGVEIHKVIKIDSTNNEIPQVNINQDNMSHQDIPQTCHSHPNLLHEAAEVSLDIFPQDDKTMADARVASDHEFSDMDFDDDDMDGLIDLVHPQHNMEAAVAEVEHEPFVSVQEETSELAVVQCQPSQQTVPEPVPVRSVQDDEFGDDEFADFDFSDDAWDQVAASIALSQQNSVAAQPTAVVDVNQSTKRTAAPVAQTEFDEFDDEFDDNDFLAAEALSKGNHSEIHKLAIQRYLVQSVREGLYVNEHNQNQAEKVVVVEQEKSTTILYVILRQAWYETQCTSGSYVHIFGKFDSSNRCIVDNARNMIILHPDHLVSATVVADSFGCIRRAVLQDRVKATGSASAPMLYGNILHELCQEALKINRWDMKKLNEILEGILPRHYETMVEIGLTLKQAHEFLSPKMLEMGAWAAKFVRSLPARDATISSRGGSTARMSINKLLDVEEHVWSPNYGLKGNIDATVQVTIEDNGKHRTLTVPFEIKTGKRASEAHQAQTALYTLLISDRYDIDVTDGILYYLESSKTVQVKAIRHELIHMIMKRNELACYIRERRQLPPMLESNRQRLCNGCYAQTTCHLYHKLSEDGNGTLIERKDQFKSLVAHLKPIHSSFFKKWDFLITKEESEMMKFRRELWTMISSEREKVNRCFSNVIIMPGSKSEDNSTISKINRFQYTFVKQNPKPGFSFTESQLTTGEPIVVSDERGHFALANGYVTTVHRHSIIVAVDRRLHNARKRKSGFCSQNNQTFGGIMEVNPAPQTQSSEDDEPILYRLDKDEFSNGMATVRNNMLQIMDNSIFKAADLRSMVIEEREPVFSDCMSGWRMPSQALVGEMNSDQKTAVEKVMTAKDYALVLGMPGTGKTTTIAQIIRSLVAKGKTVLLTSYTHTAVDNILIKLRLAGIDVLRLGVISKIHPEVREFAVLGAEQRDSLEEVHATWHKPQVVATTCLGINHPLFSQRTFDYCIVDEASQITLPVCLGPIRMAKTFILVGDHYQLPPIVQNREALEGGLDMSLFRLLCEKHPQAVVSLEHQYRMCDDIMSIANKLIYSGRLKCGNNAIATRTLELPKTSEALAIPHSSALIPQPSASSGPVYICPSASYATCWLSPLLNPKNRVIFLNTDNLGQLGEEVSRGNRTTNPIEAILITQMTTLLINAGLSSSDLGIVTFYRSQLALLRQSLRHYSSLELHTADKFQGRDKEAVIVSFVRNNSDGNVGELLQDWRRINVAVTRARSKLILVGSAKTLAAGPEVLKGLVELCREKEWIYDLPEGAVDMHVAPDRGLWTQSPVAKSQKKRSLDASIDLTSPTTKKSLPRGALYGTDPNKVQCQHINGGMKKPARVGTISERVLASKPLFRDIMHDILGDNLT